MARQENEFFQRLEDVGLNRVLDDLLDKNKIVRLANACGLKYPGSRTRSQTRERLLGDLVTRAGEEETTRKAILRALQKETRVAIKSWQTLPDEEKARRLSDEQFLLTAGNLGLHLFLLASLENDSDRGELETELAWRQLLRVLENGARSASPQPTRAETRLQKKTAALERKIQHVEAQLTRSRETEKRAKREGIQRKGELAEARMLVERLRRDLARVQAEAKKGTDAGEAVSELGKAIRRLASEQKKLAYRIEKLDERPAKAEEPEPLAALADSFRALQRDVAAVKREQKKEAERHAAWQEALRNEIGIARAAARSKTKKAGRPRAKSEPRVGVFIDVQNVYYGARQLKGKLDFDALIQSAVLDRRLVQATAYVVESKEIDQSGFIALLQQRGIEVRRKILSVRADGSMKGDWDMELALDILDGAPNLDVVVLVSGDGDFTSLLRRVKKMGPRVEVIGFPRNTAKSLQLAADRFQPLDRKFIMRMPPETTSAERPAKSGKKRAAKAVRSKA